MAEHRNVTKAALCAVGLVLGMAFVNPLRAGEARAADAAAPRQSSAATAAANHMLRDFTGKSFDYYYGETWKQGSSVSSGAEQGVAYVQIDATENGGGGVVLGGADLAPAGQTHLILRVRLMSGHGGGQIRINLMGQGNQKAELSLPTSYLDTKSFKTVAVRLPSGAPRKLEQIQIQGANFSPAAKPFKMQIASIGTATVGGSASQ